MSNIDIIRAWKDEEYRDSLSESQLSQLPENPAGLVELPDEVTQTLAGGCRSQGIFCRPRLSLSVRICCDFPRKPKFLK